MGRGTERPREEAGRDNASRAAKDLELKLVIDRKNDTEKKNLILKGYNLAVQISLIITLHI